MTDTLFDIAVAHARRGDPETSHDAAASVKHITALKERILVLLRMYGAQTDTELIETFRSAYPHFQATDQSIRSRRSELVADGSVEFSGEYGVTSTGRKSRKWATA